MLRKIILLSLIFLKGSLLNAQVPVKPYQLNSEDQKLLLGLSTNFFTAAKENQVDLDSSLIYVSHRLNLLRVQVAAEGIEDSALLKQSSWFDAQDVTAGLHQLDVLKGKKLAEQLILIGAYYAFEPGNNQQTNNLAVQYLIRASNACKASGYDELFLVSQRLLGKVFLKQSDLSEAANIFQSTIKSYTSKNDKYNVAKTLQWWELYAPVASTNTIERINNASTASELFDAIGNKKEEVNALINRSYLYLLSYKVDSAYSTALLADSLCEKIQFPYTQYVKFALNVIALFQGKFGESLQYGIEGANTAELLKDSISLPYLYGNLGALYATDEFNQDVAIKWNIKSINCFLQQHEPCYLAMSNTVVALILQQRSTQAYQLIQQVFKTTPPKLPADFLFYYLALTFYHLNTKGTDSASAYLTRADSIETSLEKNGMDIRKAALLFAHGQLCMGEKKYEKAGAYFRQFIEQNSDVGGTINSKAIAWRNLIFIDSVSGNKEQQITDYRNYTAVMANYNLLSRTRLAEELQVKYATAAKEDQIKLLTQKSLYEQDKAEQANVVKNITVAIIILLLIIAFLLYRQNANRKKNNKIISTQNRQLQHLVEEKEWLVKEVHHRVKNNLQTIISLLESQANYLSNDALKAIEKSQHRIYAMSLIHQKLYQSDDLKVINIKTYLTDFLQYLIEGFGLPANIRLVTDVDNIELSASQAIPLGLIVNETVSNSFKYAFPNNREGIISVALKRKGQRIFLTIADDGIGSQKKPGDNLNSLGLELINGLSSDLQANIVFEVNDGTIITLDFLIDPLSAKVETSEVIS